MAHFINAQGRVYPRLHGGTRAFVGFFSDYRGLSPSARGNRTKGLNMIEKLGSIPVCTGEPLYHNSMIRIGISEFRLNF